MLLSVVFDFGFFFNATNHCSCLRHKYRIALLQSIRSRKTTQVQVAQNGDTANAVRVKKSTLALFYMYAVYLVCYLPISWVVLAKTKGEIALFSHLWYFTLTRLVYRHNTYEIADKSASILTNQILQSAKAIPMIKRVLKMIETTMR